MSIWNSSFKELFSKLFDELSLLFQKYIIIREEVKISNDAQSNEALANIMVGTVFGLLLQQMLNPAKNSLEDSLDRLDALSLQWFCTSKNN